MGWGWLGLTDADLRTSWGEDEIHPVPAYSTWGWLICDLQWVATLVHWEG
jgi:hypothetical protein